MWHFQVLLSQPASVAIVLRNQETRKMQSGFSLCVERCQQDESVIAKENKNEEKEGTTKRRQITYQVAVNEYQMKYNGQHLRDDIGEW